LILSNKNTHFFCGGGIRLLATSPASKLISVFSGESFHPAMAVAATSGAIHTMQGRVKFIRIYPYQKGLVSFIFFLDLVLNW